MNQPIHIQPTTPPTFIEEQTVLIYHMVKDILTKYPPDDDLESFVLERIIRRATRGKFIALTDPDERTRYISRAVRITHLEWLRHCKRQFKPLQSALSVRDSASRTPLDEMILAEDIAECEAELKRHASENKPGNFSRKQYTINKLKRERHARLSKRVE